MRLAAYLLELLTGGYGTASALHIACWEGSIEAVTAISSGSKISMQEWHERPGDFAPLHIAALCGHCNVAEYILQLGVDGDLPTVHELRALHISASSSPDVCEVLLGCKAEPGVLTADADTPLHFACCYQQLSTMELLLEARGDARAANNFGVTPLHVAVAHAALEGLEVRDAHSVLLLCRRRADPKALDKHGKTPLDVACAARGDPSLVDFLKNHAAGRFTGGSPGGQGGILPMLPRESSSDASPSRPRTFFDDSGSSDESESLFLPSMRNQKLQGGAPPVAAKGGRSVVELAEENAALAKDVARLTQALDESRSRTQLLEGLLDQWRGTVEQMKGVAIEWKQQSNIQASAAMEQLKVDVGREREDFQLNQQASTNERQQLQEAQAHLQQQLSDALAATNGLNQEKCKWLGEKAALEQQLATAQAEASVAASAEAGRKSAELEEQRMAEDSVRSALHERQEELRHKDAELDVLRKELEQRRSELTAVREVVSSQSGELDTIQKEMRRLGGDLQRQVQERERTGESLAQLRAQHSEMRDAHAKEALRYQEAETSFKEREVALKGQVQSEEMRSNKLEQDASELAERLKEMGDYRERAERADRMLQPLEQRIEELRLAFNAEQALRKRYHNQMQDLKGAIRVFARVRPAIKREAGESLVVRKQDAFSLEIDSKDSRQPPKVINFDSVFDEHNSQEDVFAECRGLVSSAVDGFNVTVFAYGQTGAGKTHTMYGSADAPGLVPRIADELFELLGKYAHECQAKVRCSMFELYRDDLVDLLALKGKKAPPALDIKRDPRGSVYVDNATDREATSPAELLKAIADGQERRHVASTKMNADSSRSHLICTIVIESSNRKTKQVATGKLTLCDLAGSERLKRTEVQGDQVKEAQSINKSLSALGDVIEALTKNAKHVPYRNHKLTQLLSDSLGGNAKTLMFVNCSPAGGNVDETAAALGYASRAKQIMNKVEKNQDSQEVARLKKVIQVMSQELETARAAAGGEALPQPQPQG